MVQGSIVFQNCIKIDDNIIKNRFNGSKFL